MQGNRPDRGRSKSRAARTLTQFPAPVGQVLSTKYENHLRLQIDCEISHMLTKKQLARRNPAEKFAPIPS
jgi:hypothetical protein